MKYFFICILLVISSSALAQNAESGTRDGESIVVTGNYPAAMATVTPLAPGRARIEMTPVYKVGINQPPPNARNPKQSSDISGHGTVFISRAGRLSMDVGQLICWKGVNIHQHACGPIEGTSTTAILEVGQAVRGQMLVLYPVIEDQVTQAQLAFAAHPQNTQAQLQCERSGTENMASFLYVDKQGVITIATLEQIALYQQTYSARC